MEHPNHIPEAAFQALVWRQVRLLIYCPHVAMKCGSGHRKRPLHKLAAHLNHWSLLAIDQDSVFDRLPSGVDVEYVDRFVAGARCPVAAVDASARRTNAIACMQQCHKSGPPRTVQNVGCISAEDGRLSAASLGTRLFRRNQTVFLRTEWQASQ